MPHSSEDRSNSWYFEKSNTMPWWWLHMGAPMYWQAPCEFSSTRLTFNSCLAVPLSSAMQSSPLHPSHDPHYLPLILMMRSLECPPWPLPPPLLPPPPAHSSSQAPLSSPNWSRIASPPASATLLYWNSRCPALGKWGREMGIYNIYAAWRWVSQKERWETKRTTPHCWRDSRQWGSLFWHCARSSLPPPRRRLERPLLQSQTSLTTPSSCYKAQQRICIWN